MATAEKAKDSAKDRDSDPPEDIDEPLEEEAAPKTGGASHQRAKKAVEPITPEALGVRPVTPPPPPASLGKSVSTFMFVLIALAAGFWFLGNAESPFNKPGVPKWTVGTTVTVLLTLDPKDDDNLACASDAEIGGKHCEFKDKTARFGDKSEDATTLKPYKTVQDEPLLAAGVWSGPDIAKGKRPTGRFNLKCQFKVEGKVTRPLVRWAAAGPWGEQDVDWFAGSVSNCTIEK